MSDKTYSEVGKKFAAMVEKIETVRYGNVLGAVQGVYARANDNAAEQLRDLLEADAKMWKERFVKADEDERDYLDGRASGARQVLCWFYGSFPKYRPEPKGCWGFWRDSLTKAKPTRCFQVCDNRDHAEEVKARWLDHNPGEVFFLEEEV